MLIWNKTNIFNSLFLVQTKQTKTNKQIINSVTPSWPSYEDHQLYHFHLPIPQPIYDPTDEYYPMPCRQLSLHPQKGIQRKQNHEKYHQTSLANVRTLIDQKNQTTHVVHFYWPRKEYYESKESNEKKNQYHQLVLIIVLRTSWSNTTLCANIHILMSRELEGDFMSINGDMIQSRDGKKRGECTCSKPSRPGLLYYK